MISITPDPVLKKSPLSRRFFIITFMFSGVLLGLLTYTVMTLQKDKSTALLIDIAGRQRMLLQKHLNEVFLTTEGLSADYQSTRRLLQSTLKGLIEGGTVLLNSETGERQHIPIPSTQEISEKLKEQRRHINHLFLLSDEFLLLGPTHSDFLKQLENLRAEHSLAIQIADEAVKQLDKYSENTISTMVKWEFLIAFFVGLLGLLGTNKGIRDGQKLEKEIEERNRVETALRDSELFLNSIVENIPHMIFVKSAQDLRFVRLNKAGETLLERSRFELLNKTDYDMFPKEQADFFSTKDQEVLAGKKLVDICEEPIQTKSNGLRYLHTKKIPLCDEQGHPQYLLGISEDISTRKEAEKALQEWKALTDSMLGQLPKGFAYRCLNDKNWSIIYISEGIEEVTGFPVSALLSGSITYDTLMAPGENERVWPIVQDALAKRIPYENEHRIITRDGKMKWILARGRFIFDETGKLLHLDGLNVDITEHKENEENLRASESRFRTLVNHVPFCIHEIELNGKISSMNQAGQKMIEIKNESQVIGRSYLELAEERDHERIRRYFTQAIQGQPVACEFNVTTHGNVNFFTKSFIPIRGNDGTVSKIVGISEDITERKRAEERFRESEAKRIDALRQSDELKSALLSSVSHELRTPLTAIKASVSSILGHTPSGMSIMQQEFLNGIDLEINYMSRLVDNLLDMSQIEAGTLVPHQEWHPLEDLVEGALRHTEQTFTQKNIKILFPENVPPVYVDALGIQQVLINLLDNAAKYSSPESSIQLEVYQKTQQIIIQISNEGEPIPTQEIDRIFDRFYRCQPQRRQPVRGTGLGLAICKGIIEAHGGQILAHSSDSKVTITIHLPVTESMESFSLEGLCKDHQQ